MLGGLPLVPLPGGERAEERCKAQAPIPMEKSLGSHHARGVRTRTRAHV